MTNEQITEAIIRLQPSAQFVLSGDDYDNINWLSEFPKPTKSAIAAEIAKEPEIAMAKANAKQAILDRLGITAEEVALLFK